MDTKTLFPESNVSDILISIPFTLSWSGLSIIFMAIWVYLIRRDVVRYDTPTFLIEGVIIRTIDYIIRISFICSIIWVPISMGIRSNNKCMDKYSDILVSALKHHQVITIDTGSFNDEVIDVKEDKAVFFGGSKYFSIIPQSYAMDKGKCVLFFKETDSNRVFSTSCLSIRNSLLPISDKDHLKTLYENSKG